MTFTVKKKSIKYFQRRILEWGCDNFQNYPWRFTTNKWHALVAEIMLQRTKADQVEPVYNNFVKIYNSPMEFVNNPIKIFSKLGLPVRDNQFLELNKNIIEKGLPFEKTQLKQLPGVGDYIASAFLSLHCGIRDALIDSNIVRFYGKFFGFETDPETRRKKWFKELAETVTPQRKYRKYNYAIIDFSRNACKSKPDHLLCPLQYKCHYFLFNETAIMARRRND